MADNAASVSAPELLDAITDLLHVNRLGIHANQGGSWFYDGAGMDTYPLDADALVALRDKVAEELEKDGNGWMMPTRRAAR